MGIDNGVGSVGIAPNAIIMPIKVLDSENFGALDQINGGIVFAVNRGAKVINMSLASREKSLVLLEDALNFAATHDVLVVAAVGNEASNTPMYPAWYDQTMAISATNPKDNFWGLSNWGEWVDISAPGETVWSTWWKKGG